MASQVIVMPPALLDSILDYPETPRMVAFGSQGLHTIVGSMARAGRVLRIEIDRLDRCPGISNRLSDDVFAILLTSSPSPDALPEPLPGSLVHSLLNEIETALMALRRLTAHDKLEIAVAIEAARNAPGTGIWMTACPPFGSTEAAILSRASELQARLQPGLDLLDAKLAAYGGAVRKAGLETAVARLGLQADLGAVLQLDPVAGGFLPGIMTKHRYGDFEKLWRAMRNRLAAFQSALDAMHRAARTGENWLEDLALPLQGTLLQGLAEQQRCGCFRFGAMVIRSPFTGEHHDVAVPAEEVSSAMDTFTRCYDSRLWRSLHPLIRAGLSHCELVRVHPFSDGNGRLARLLLLTMLIEDRLPALPLEAVFYWNRRSYIERTDAAVRNADLLAFMQWMISAVENSVGLGWRFMRKMEPARDRLRESFADGGAHFAAIAAEQSVSMLLGPDLQVAQRTMCMQDLARHLRLAGLDPVFGGDFEIAGDRMSVAYSCPLARELLIEPDARI